MSHNTKRKKTKGGKEGMRDVISFRITETNKQLVQKLEDHFDSFNIPINLSKLINKLLTTYLEDFLKNGEKVKE
jgi:hexokinase